MIIDKSISFKDFTVLYWHEGKAHQVIIDYNDKTLFSYFLVSLGNGTIKVHAEPIRGIARGAK
jgi:hypothetical protein